MISKDQTTHTRVKIVATIGPSSANAATIDAMLHAGMNAARLNFSHGDHDDHARAYRLLRDAAKARGRHIAVIADLSGPKIRCGRMKDGGVTLRKDATVEITPDDIEGTAERIGTSYAHLYEDVREGSRILLDDGRLTLVVTGISGRTMTCRVAVGGVLSDHKGMNLPGVPLSVSALTEKDRDDLAFACALGVDYLALSFVRTASDVREAKSLAGEVPVIAKIEKPEAIDNIEEIIAAADGLMVARGDLGVEAGAEKVPMLQKRIIREAAVAGLPVIVATQMMESMIASPTPTRAEVSDVANAVLDGTDAVMLSGETAVGRYPVETVQEMNAVVKAIETSDILALKRRSLQSREHPFSSAIAGAAVTACDAFDIETVAVYTETGHTAALVSANRPDADIAAFSRHPQVLGRLALRWGVVPVDSDWLSGAEAMVEEARDRLSRIGIVSPGDPLALAFGLGEPGKGFQTDTLRLMTV